MEITNRIVANALASRGVARNAYTVEEQREFKEKELPKIQRELAEYAKQCEAIAKEIVECGSLMQKIDKVKDKSRKILDYAYNEYLFGSYDKAWELGLNKEGDAILSAIEKAQRNLRSTRDRIFHW